MITIGFYTDSPPEELFKFAVIAARYNGIWIFCRHGSRDTYEIPGGHREEGENIDETARRELYEETGAVEFDLSPITAYGVTIDGETTYGKLFFAEIKTLGELPRSEIAEIMFEDDLPINLTYPEIQPMLFEKVRTWAAENVHI